MKLVGGAARLAGSPKNQVPGISSLNGELGSEAPDRHRDQRQETEERRPAQEAPVVGVAVVVGLRPGRPATGVGQHPHLGHLQPRSPPGRRASRRRAERAGRRPGSVPGTRCSGVPRVGTSRSCSVGPGGVRWRGLSACVCHGRSSHLDARQLGATVRNGIVTVAARGRNHPSRHCRTATGARSWATPPPWWAGEDSNLRRLSRQVYSLFPLATRTPTRSGEASPTGYPGRLGRAGRYRGAMPTFDIVSEVDMQEVRNAVDQANREASTRFDFKGTDSSIDLGDERAGAPLLHRGPPPGPAPGARGEAGQAAGLPEGARRRQDRGGGQGSGPPEDRHPGRASPRTTPSGSTGSSRTWGSRA